MAKETNKFSQWSRSVFRNTQPFCAKCGSNQMCSIHHIYGRCSSALFNGIVLCLECHAEADCFNQPTGIKGTSFRRELLRFTLIKLYSDNYWAKFVPRPEKKKIAEFLDMIQDDYQFVMKLK